MGEVADIKRQTRQFIAHARAGIKQTDRMMLLVHEICARRGFLGKIVERRFETQGASSGQTWKRLATATIVDRKRLGFPGEPILVRTGRLRDAAVNGDPIWSASDIGLRIKRRAAPRYTGRGKWKRRKADNPKDARIEVYAYKLNQDRPFYGPASGDEAVELLAYRRRVIASAMHAAANGEDPIAFLEQLKQIAKKGGG